MMGGKRPQATCHPEKLHHCKGLCQQCYNKQSLKRRSLDPEFRKKAADRTRKWALDNPERVYILDANKHLQKRYGITLNDYYKMLDDQKGLCAICKKPETVITKKRVSRLSVDHCHATGKIRGLLCTKCNKVLGAFNDSIELFQSAIKYLGETK
jgi:hypothetical protein